MGTLRKGKIVNFLFLVQRMTLGDMYCLQDKTFCYDNAIFIQNGCFLRKWIDLSFSTYCYMSLFNLDKWIDLSLADNKEK